LVVSGLHRLESSEANPMKRLPPVLILLILASCACNRAPDTTCSVIHEPKSGCPKGYTRELEPRFTERDHSKEFACVAKDPEQYQACTDVLRPGEVESVEVQIEIIPAQPAPPDQPKKGKT
jgi:hypothetical protein